MTASNSPSVSNPGNFLRTSRNFPAEIKQLAVEVNRSYVDIAGQVNNRICSIYGLNVVITTGESWFLNGNVVRQQTLRQVYSFTGTGPIATVIPWNTISLISPKSYGTFTDGTSWYGCIYGSSVAIAGQVTFYVSQNMSTGMAQINVLSGAGAPSITLGYIILEWLSQF